MSPSGTTARPAGKSATTAAAHGEVTAPAHATWWAVLVYAVSTLLLGYPALAGKFLVNARSDQYIAGYAFRDFAAQSLKAGHGIPQWEPFIQGGMPYIAAMHGDIFYPTALLRWLLPTDVAMTWEFIIHLFLAGLFTYLFLRAWRFGFWPALFGGLAYMLGGAVSGLASPGHDGKLFVATLTPLGLLLLTHAVRDGKRWAWPAFGLVVGLTFLTPHPQLFQYFLILGGSYTLYLAFSTHPDGTKLSTNTALTRVALALLAVVIGLAVGALQYWPSMIEYTPWSPRAGGHSYAEATSFSYPIEEVLNWYWPQFSGILDNYWGRNGLHLHSDYVGVIALMLGGAAFGTTTRKSFRWFWGGVFIVSLLWAFGGNTAFYHLVMLVPGTKFLRAPSTMIFITSLSIAMFVAMGVERIIKQQLSARYALTWGVGAAVFALFMTVGGYRALAGAVASSIAGGYPAEAHSQVVSEVMTRVEPNTGAAILGVWRSVLFVGLGAGALWAWSTGKLAAKHALIALTLFAVADLWSVGRNYWMFMPPAREIFATDPAAAAIKADIAKTGVQGRVLPLPVGDGIVTERGIPDRTFSGNKLWSMGLRSPTGYHGNELGAYQRMLSLSIDSIPISFHPAFWRQENVRYLYTGANEQQIAQIAAQLGIAAPQKLAGPVRNATGSMVYSYKLPVDNPPAWVATATVKAPRDAALSTVLDSRFDPRSAAIADTSFHDAPAQDIQALPPASTITPTVTSFEPGAIDVKLDKPALAGQSLVVSENYFPGWRATVDGKPAPVGIMNYNLIGLPLPAGATTVQLHFTDDAYQKGKKLTAVAILGLLLWLGAGLVMDRRHSTPAAA